MVLFKSTRKQNTAKLYSANFMHGCSSIMRRLISMKFANALDQERCYNREVILNDNLLCVFDPSFIYSFTQLRVQ